MPKSPDGTKARQIAEIEALVAALTHHEPVKRQEARQSLEAVGRPAAEALVKLLEHPKAHVRWEAAKALGAIRDPAAATALVARLTDKDDDVRWVAAEALIALRRQAIKPLLEALADKPDSTWLQQGAHHVFNTLLKKRAMELLFPILAALKQEEPELAIPQAVSEVLQALEAGD
ncbi:MAG: HEAT repeat domain-containing protein [Pirellulales bacterium]|nr:HEAT repeat domain-containing protein [Pirellulales bacterium]